MKIISEPLYKWVNYFGLIMAFPFWVKFIATDADGTIKVFERVPHRHIHEEDSVWWFKNGGRSEAVATVDLEGMDWRETLMEVEG